MTGIADTGTAAAVIHKLTYGFDAANNVLSITDGVTAANSQTLGYDVINRLITATGSYGTLGYGYDANGNRLKQTVGSVTTTYAYTAASNILASYTTGSTTTNVATNANGNITSIPPANSIAPATFAYNVANRLSSVVGSPIGATFLYDAFGQRFSKADPGYKPTTYIYGPGGTLLEENDNGAVTDYLYANGRPVGTYVPSTGRVYFIQTDHLGTPQLVTDSTQKTVWKTTYQPFGTTGMVTASITQNLRFPGQYADTETGFSYNMNRDYMPNLGRYLENDPIGLYGGLNSYKYADANPSKLFDPKGLKVTMTCTSTFGMWAHCADFVWHWSSDDPCDKNRHKIIDRQYSLGEGGQTPLKDPNNPTSIMDRTFFLNPWALGTDYDIPVPNGMTQAQFDQAVTAVGDNYSQDPYFLLGPNSNTAANSIITQAGGSTPDVWNAYGQNAIPHFQSSGQLDSPSLMVPILPLF